MPLSLTHFGLAEMLRWGIDLPRLAAAAGTLEEAAQSVVRHIYDEAISPAGARECALVRCYVTQRCDGLPSVLQAHAGTALHAEPRPDLQCLVLMGTAGDEPEWNHRHLSRAHQVIPMDSVQAVRRTPMVGQLLRSMGVKLETAVAPRPELMRGLSARSYDVFYVPEALGSAHIHDQDFVRQYGVRSVLGFGGALERGGFYTLIIFSRAEIPEGARERFRTLAQDLKEPFGGFPAERTFAATAAVA